MGWGKWLLLGDLGQQLDITNQQEEIEKLKLQLQAQQAAPGSLEERLNLIQRDVDELKLYLAALIRLLIAKKLTTSEEMRTLVTAVDKEDGTQNRKYEGPLVPPPK